jgi:hypothetical protein
MAKKVKKMALGGLSRAVGRTVRNNISRMPPPNPQSMAPAGARMGTAPMPNATRVMPKTLGFAKTALDTIKANASKYPEMRAPEGVPESYGSIRPMPTPGRFQRANAPRMPMKKGGAVKSSASKRADGCAMKGKTKGRFV